MSIIDGFMANTIETYKEPSIQEIKNVELVIEQGDK